MNELLLRENAILLKEEQLFVARANNSMKR